MEKLIARPNGIVLVTGPTGSGKTTTLYAALSRINRTDQNIITIEDPVEIQLPGVGQIEVNAKIGLTFANGAALGPAPGPERDPGRRDPRPRDRRDRDPGLAHRPPGVLDAAHQRRAERDHAPRRHGRRAVPGRRRRWSRCWRSAWCACCAPTAAEPYEATAEELAEIGVQTSGRAVRLYRAEGCARCHHTGYRGRLGIFELMLIDDDIRALVTRTSTPRRSRRRRCASGMRTLRRDGARKVLEGITSIEEVLRATEDEGVVAQIYVR